MYIRMDASRSVFGWFKKRLSRALSFKYSLLLMVLWVALLYFTWLAYTTLANPALLHYVTSGVETITGNKLPKDATNKIVGKNVSKLPMYKAIGGTALYKNSSEPNRALSPSTALMSKSGLPGLKCDGCYHWKFKYVLTPRDDLCKVSPKGFVHLVVIAISVHSNKAQRDLLRQVYDATQWVNHNVRLIFAFGNDPGADKNKESELKKENEKHHDIFQVSVNGTYRNLTLITLNVYRWLNQSCQNAKFITRITEDVILNIPGLLLLLDKKGETELANVEFGDCIKTSKPIRGKHIWGISKRAYPYDTFPPYCHGGGFSMSIKLIQKLIKQSSNTRYITDLDDVDMGTIVQLIGHCTCHISAFSLFYYPGSPFMKLTIPIVNSQVNCTGFHKLKNFLGVHLHGFGTGSIHRFWEHRKCYEPLVSHDYISSLKCPCTDIAV